MTPHHNHTDTHMDPLTLKNDAVNISSKNTVTHLSILQWCFVGCRKDNLFICFIMILQTEDTAYKLWQILIIVISLQTKGLPLYPSCSASVLLCYTCRLAVACRTTLKYILCCDQHQVTSSHWCKNPVNSVLP